MTMPEYYRNHREFDKLPYHEQVETLNRFIEQDRKHWQDIFENGCSDPFWEDGVNMNLVRNHIIAWVRTLYEIDQTDRQMDLFDLFAETVPKRDFMDDERIPPKVPSSFMAKDRVVFGEMKEASPRDFTF